MEAHQLTLSVPTVSESATVARRQATDAIEGWHAGLGTEVVDTAALVISELVTNAVRHAGTGRVSVAVRLVEDLLRIEVCDASPQLPRPGLPDLLSEGGRGLFLVAALVDRFGTEPTVTGKQCWAEITLPGGSKR